MTNAFGILYVTLLASCLTPAVKAFGLPLRHGQLIERVASPSSSSCCRVDTRISESGNSNDKQEPEEKNAMDFLLNPYESSIPPEIEKEIYEAEGNTPAAKDRTARVIGYAVVAITGFMMAVFNAFITQLRNAPTPDGTPFDLDQTAFGWVNDNFLAQFFFMNKIGGGLVLLIGLGCGLLAETELDNRRKNAEKIFQEMKRRKEAKAKVAVGSKKAQRNKNKNEKPAKKKRQSGKVMKRLGAIAEVAAPEPVTKIESASTDEQPPATEKQDEPSKEKESGGFMGAFKDFYDKADKMAASQALLLNKELEDRGIVEKITDESGLKVIGKDAAAKIDKSKDKGE